MTIKQAALSFGTLSVKASLGDTLRKIVFRTYHSYETKYFDVILALNIRYDWHQINPGDEIKYLDKFIVDSIMEL